MVSTVIFPIRIQSSSVLHHIAAHSHTIDLLRDLCRRFLWDASLGEKLTTSQEKQTELKKSI
jgi:hypothetical protein